MSVLHLESQRAVRLNIALLFLVSVEPFLFNIVRTPPAKLLNPAAYTDATSSLYALDLGAMMLILGGFTYSLTDEDKNLIPKDLIHHFKLDSMKLFVSGALFLVTVLPFFYDTNVGGEPLRYLFWIAPMAFIAAMRAYERISSRRSSPTWGQIRGEFGRNRRWLTRPREKKSSAFRTGLTFSVLKIGVPSSGRETISLNSS